MGDQDLNQPSGPGAEDPRKRTEPGKSTMAWAQVVLDRRRLAKLEEQSAAAPQAEVAQEVSRANRAAAVLVTLAALLLCGTAAWYFTRGLHPGHAAPPGAAAR